MLESPTTKHSQLKPLILDNNVKLATTLLFLSLTIHWFLIRANFFSSYNLFVFYGVLVIALFMLQVIICNDKSGPLMYFFLLEIMIIFTQIKQLFIVRIGYYGVDSPTDYAVLTYIYEYGFDLLNIPANYLHQYLYPELYFLTISFSEISQFDLLTSTKILPLIYSQILIIGFFVLLKVFCSDWKGCIFGVLAFSSLYDNFVFHSLFLRESLAFVFFIFAVFLISKRLCGGIGGKITILILFISLIFCHHLTSFMMYLLLLLILVFAKILQSMDFNTLKRLCGIYTVLLVVHWVFIYGMYSYRSPPSKVLNTLLNLIDGAKSHSATIISSMPSTARYSLLKVGELLNGVCFGILSLISIVRNERNNHLLCAFLVFGGICGLTALGCLIGVIGVDLNPQRFLSFGYTFLIVVAFANFATNRNKKFSSVLLVVTLLLFTVNISKIDPSLVVNEEPNFFAGEYRTYVQESEYAPLLWLNSFSESGVIGTTENLRLISPFIPKKLQIAGDTHLMREIGIHNEKLVPNNQLVYLPNIALPWIKEDAYNGYLISKNLNRIYGGGKATVWMWEGVP